MLRRCRPRAGVRGDHGGGGPDEHTVSKVGSVTRRAGRGECASGLTQLPDRLPSHQVSPRRRRQKRGRFSRRHSVVSQRTALGPASMMAPSLTMWTRAATQARAQPLVDAYNASHKNQVQLTIVPTDTYVAKVGTAAGSNGLPDLVSGDVVFMPNWTSAGLFQDITDKIAALPFKDVIAPGAIQASTWEGKQYGLPFVTDLSVWMYNKKLFAQAGLDPNKPPTIAGRVQGRRRGGGQAGKWHPWHVLRRRLRRLQRVHVVADRLGRRAASHERRRHAVAPQQRREQADLQHVRQHGGRRHGLDAGLPDGDGSHLDQLPDHGQAGHHAVAGDPDRCCQRQPVAR